MLFEDFGALFFDEFEELRRHHHLEALLIKRNLHQYGVSNDILEGGPTPTAEFVPCPQPQDYRADLVQKKKN